MLRLLEGPGFFAEEGEETSTLAPISCCTLKLRSYCSITWDSPDSTRIVCAEVKSLGWQVTNNAAELRA